MTTLREMALVESNFNKRSLDGEINVDIESLDAETINRDEINAPSTASVLRLLFKGKKDY